MEVRSSDAARSIGDKIASGGGGGGGSPPVPAAIARTRLQVWFIRVCSSIVLWTCLVQLVAVCELWHPHLLAGITSRISSSAELNVDEEARLHSSPSPPPPPPPLAPPSEFCFVIFVMLNCSIFD